MLIVSLLTAFSAAALWIRGTDWIYHVYESIRGQQPPPATIPEDPVLLFDVGVRAWGFYSHDGYAGFLLYEVGYDYDDRSLKAIRASNPDNDGWHWSRSQYMDSAARWLPYLNKVWAIPHLVYVSCDDTTVGAPLKTAGVMISEPVIFGLSLLPWAMWGAMALLKWRRPIPGRCRRCGYDLRATPDRCPECGNTVMKA